MPLKSWCYYWKIRTYNKTDSKICTNLVISWFTAITNPMILKQYYISNSWLTKTELKQGIINWIKTNLTLYRTCRILSTGIQNWIKSKQIQEHCQYTDNVPFRKQQYNIHLNSLIHKQTWFNWRILINRLFTTFVNN